MILMLILILGLSLATTEAVRRYAQAHLLDLPNERSSHCLPTPRGGGLGFVLVFLGFVLYAILHKDISASLGWACFATGFGVALVGFVDDHWSISARFRLLMHACALVLGLYFLGALPAISIGIMTIPSGYLLNAIVLLALVWLLNLYNFMDGINGLAAVQAIIFCLAAASFFYQVSAPSEALLLLILAVSVAAFLCFNFPRALIFMGDVGSGFLGAVLGLFFVRALQIDTTLFVSLLILLGVFIVDANLTLFRRAYRREPLMQAHSTHAYQYASRRYGHTVVTLACSAMMMVFLYPLAMSVSQGYIHPFLGLVIAYGPLCVLATYLQRPLVHQ